MNILHLSDIHFGRNYPEYGVEDSFQNKDKILNELIEYVGTIDDSYKPEHIIVTGDVAWRGKKKDFNEAFKWFEKLLAKLNLTGENITFCVGNHDVNRAYSSGHADLTEKNICEIDELYSYNRIHEMEAPIYEYDKFCEKIGMEPFKYPLNGKWEYSYSLGYKDIEFASGNMIRIIGLNSALLSGLSQFPDDRMWLGQHQINTLIEYGVLPAKDVYYSIALFHHAERFLDPNEICEYNGRKATLPLLRDYVDLILCGHTETGGRPVLQEQVGGSKLLTAGATYYSDTHPNAFSMIHIADNVRKMTFQPYTYDGKWKSYEYENSKISVHQIKDLPSFGELHEHCKFIVSHDSGKYEIPLKKVSLYKSEKDGVPYIRLDNRKEVLRELAVECEGKITGGDAKVNVTLAPKMDKNVAAMLKREEYFEFLSDVFQHESGTKFSVTTDSGVDLFSGYNVKGTIDKDSFGLDLLRKIKKIEDFYDVKFYRPDDIFENDLAKINLLIKFIDEGYVDELKIGTDMSTELSSKELMIQWCEQAKTSNNFCLIYEKEFECILFGAKFSLGKLKIFAGIYHIDIDDLQYKINTFCDGDSRKCQLYTEKNNFFTYVVRDKGDIDLKINMGKEAEFFSVNNLQINWGFIFEKKRT